MPAFGEDIDAVAVGANTVDAIYRGSDLVWTATVAPLPTFVAAASAGGSSTTLAVDVPTGTTDGDLMICLLSSNASEPAFAGTWNTLSSGNTDFMGWRIGWRRASSEPASYTHTNFTTQASAMIVTYRDAGDPTGFAAGAPTDFSGTTVTFPAGSASGDGLWVCAGSLRGVVSWSAQPASHDTRVLTAGNAARQLHLSDIEATGTPTSTTGTASGTPASVRTFRLCVPRA